MHKALRATRGRRHEVTLEEKNETLRDLGKCITEVKRYFDNGNDLFTVQSGAWRIEFDMTSKSNKGDVQ